MKHLATLEKVERQTQHSWSEKLSILASTILGLWSDWQTGGDICGSKFISLKIALLLYCLFDSILGQIYKMINQMNIMIYSVLKITDKEVVGFFLHPIQSLFMQLLKVEGTFVLAWSIVIICVFTVNTHWTWYRCKVCFVCHKLCPLAKVTASVFPTETKEWTLTLQTENDVLISNHII